MIRRAALAAAAAAALLGLLAAPPPPAAAQSNDPSFRVVNNTQNVVQEVYASPSTERGWGQDRLGSDVIPPGQRYIIRLPAGDCVYDIRVVYQGGAAEERRNVNTCAITDFVLGASQAQQGANPSFNLVNSSGRVIEQLYASPSSQQNWGPDRLGDAVVSPGQRFAVRLPAGECVYDIRVVFAGGEAREQRRVNACGLTDYVVR